MYVGLAARIEREVQLLISCSETANEYQAKELKFIKVPEYMSSYKDLPSYAGFLGGTIVSKVFFYNLLLKLSADNNLNYNYNNSLVGIWIRRDWIH